MPFAATEFEFKNRFWIIGGVIFLAFFCYNLDHTNIAFALVPTSVSQSGDDVLVQIRPNQTARARQVPAPFYKRPKATAAMA